MKRKLTTLLLILVATLGYSQVNEVEQLSQKVRTIENQVEKIQEQVIAFQVTNDMLRKENDYFKDALKMLSPVTSATVDNIKIDLLSCVAISKIKQ